MIREPAPRALVVATGVGAALVAASSYWVAAIPFSFRASPPPVVDLLPPQAAPARIAWYLGLTLMSLAWLGLGRRLWRGEPVGVRTLQAAGFAAAVPLLLAVPLSSRDLWAYVAQARIAAAGLDPYRVSPAAFGHGPVLDVSARWVDSVSPYGPLWTLLGRGIAALSSDGTVLALLLRLPAFAGFAVLAAVVPLLARRCGVDDVWPCWLLVANPMLALHGVGGGHNDTLMVGLVALGLLAAVSPGPRARALVVGGALVGAAAAVKIPALVAAPFLPLLWDRYAAPRAAALPGAAARPAAAAAAGPGSGRPWPVAARARLPAALGGVVWSLGAGLAVLAVASAAAGHGLEWLSSANTAEHGGGPVTATLLLLVLVALWIAALARAPLPWLAAALLAPALISRLSLAWYWFWPLLPAALFLRGRVASFVVAVGSLSTLFFIRPNGQNLAVRPEFVVVAVAVVAWWVLDRHWRPLTSAELTAPHAAGGRR